ncbi:hypothetical protein SAMN05428963_108167 [Consotaella salsifontis]|uniref:DUF2946 domain-containing protein n=1 Tax=Consotaella salsifontis TaxID=1365950 RepID=A0A1T4S172_9HYPH|nr:hypothetical protein SAMN05428963_108167 [Consotaella salsifontis]
MRRLRGWTRDRGTVLPFTLFLVQLLFAQLFLSGLACASMALPGTAGATVLCQSADAAQSTPEKPALPSGCCLDCPCATACGGMQNLLAAIPPLNSIGLVEAIDVAGLPRLPQARTVSPRPPPGLIPSPRAPPAIFV